MSGMVFVLLALIVLFAGMGGIMLIGTKMRQDHEARTLMAGTDPDDVKRLAEAVESLQAQVSDLNERVEFTERLLEAPDAADPEQIPGTSGGAAPPG